MASNRSQGMTLLEVIVALAILAMTGTALIATAHESIVAVARARTSGAEIQEASAFMDAVTLWSRTELDQRLGHRRQGKWWLRIDRPFPSLYTLVLSDSQNREVLRTSLYRHAPDASQ